MNFFSSFFDFYCGISFHFTDDAAALLVETGKQIIKFNLIF